MQETTEIKKLNINLENCAFCWFMFYSFLLCLITVTAAAIFTECSAFEDIFPYRNDCAAQERVNRMIYEERHSLNWCTDLCSEQQLGRTEIFCFTHFFCGL